MAGLAGGKPGLRLYDPVADRDLWTLALAQQAKISILDNDRAAVIDQGAIVFAGTAAELRARGDLQSTYLGVGP